jgi:murein DD-endopeptidase MepM/ murein hydrolase activator NlpD
MLVTLEFRMILLKFRPFVFKTVLSCIIFLTANTSVSVAYADRAYAHSHSTTNPPQPSSILIRKELFDQVSLLTHIPWYILAAIDQYERTMHLQQHANSEHRITAIQFSTASWSGILNPNQVDTDPLSIAFFGGLGRDGSGDQIASPTNDLDVLATVALILQKNGNKEQDLYIALWDYYQNTRSVERIQQFAAMYKYHQTLDLHTYQFPLPLSSDYAYRSTWGAKRGWGGRRTHEGIDLFASSGIPVKSASYGIIEELGWNRYGGWRVGIRDPNNIYHYYAHLQGFDKKLKIGDVVQPNKMIGWIGSSGYGKPGTSGKFPPHLHYGMYRDQGNVDWPFDPFPFLQKWERNAKNKEKQRTNK